MKTLLRLLALFTAAACLTGCSSLGDIGDAPRVLVFSHSTGYRHASIEPGVAAVRAMAERKGYEVVTTEDPNVFSEAGLAGVDAIVLVSISTKPDDVSSEWFTGDRRTAFEAFVHRGGGVVGIHAASDSHYHWPWYGRMIGGYFTSHPPGTPTGTVRIVDRDHPSTASLHDSLSRTDEWYYFKDHNPEMRLLAVLDPASIGEADVNPNPMSWAHEFEGGRVFYTAMGHTAESYAEPAFLTHLEGGLDWVLRRR